jgi:hypothetical protein
LTESGFENLLGYYFLYSLTNGKAKRRFFTQGDQAEHQWHEEHEQFDDTPRPRAANAVHVCEDFEGKRFAWYL